VSDAAALGIAALVTGWLDAPLWVWLPLALLAVGAALAELGS
jgi:hypothetical protein